ncbi:MAG: sialidase family protein [Firmicutes bacterium]|uniref:Sortilin, neurotensin receptor 3 n=1 Tax=Kroppenstedtia guangzhouensis TaxID=1274356 RepID=A0ABQ1H3G8_9BACL|nr:sialidase family protein [Kroppenstedtia guangzhouensis]EGK10281.1 BNR repeat domain protein [Desmospora sp. 8437]MDA8353155.1 sialidase family protein [Bacillota bacterium]GGA57423.1 hypothetical protein GCM10007416_33320 [Kroppenstedtia guangzhouensis]
MKTPGKPQRWWWIIVTSVLLLSACGQDSSFSAEHIHGFAYSAKGSHLLMATHDGLYSYKKGQWTGPTGEAHDLMGFALTQKGIFSSGHPPEGSSRPNPLGLIKSTDEGKTWKTIDFEGQSDFHHMTAGYQTGALYVMNEHPNPKMGQGFHASLDGGKTWKPTGLDGMKGELLTLEAHPTREKTVALGTNVGLFLLKDPGNRVTVIDGDRQVTALLFDRKQPNRLWAGVYTNRPILTRYDIKSRKSEAMQLPLDDPEDAVQFIAQHPQKPNTIAIATFNKQVFISENGGQNWKQILKEGKSI